MENVSYLRYLTCIDPVLETTLLGGGGGGG